MIRPIDIRLNAAHPELPLAEAVTFTGSPSTVLIRGVPPNCGRWAITAVSVAATFPDGSTTTRAAVQSANGVWVATLPATATSGRTANGLRILADGIDENGDAVTGYILGVADFAVASLAVTPAPQPGETSYQMLYFDTAPHTPRKGDVAKIDGVLRFCNGSAWEAFDARAFALAGQANNNVNTLRATLTTNYYTKTETDALTTLTERGYSAWEFSVSGLPEGVTPQYTFSVEWIPAEAGLHDDGWMVSYNGSYTVGFVEGSPNAEILTVTASNEEFWDISGATITATRTALPGYVLGTQTEKPLASEAEAESLRAAVAAKYAKPSGGIPATDLAAAVQTSLGKADTALQAHQQLVDVYGDPSAAKWVCSPASMTGYATPYSVAWELIGEDTYAWVLSGGDGSQHNPLEPGDPSAGTLSFHISSYGIGQMEVENVTATRVPVSYQLGSQSDRKLATAEQGALAQTAVQPVALNAKLDKADVVAPSTASSASGKAADAKATGEALAQKQDRYSAWSLIVDGSPETGIMLVLGTSGWTPYYGGDPVGVSKGDATSTSLSWDEGEMTIPATPLYATRTVLLDGKANRASPSTAGNLAALDANGNPTDSGVKPSDKLNCTSAAPAFSTSSTYAVGDHVTYNGELYRCTTAVTTAGAWTGSTNWTAEDMTTPDATLDVTATDKLLRLVSTNGDVIWGQGYNLSTTSSATVLTEQVSAFTFAADAAADQAIVLPSVAAGKVGDFILDVTNLSANDRSLTLTGLDSAFSVVVKAGDDLSETLTVAAGEMARYYFTMTAFRVNSLPTWQVAKEAVENGGAQS